MTNLSTYDLGLAAIRAARRDQACRTNLSTYDLDLAAIRANRRDQARWEAIEIDAMRAARQKDKNEERQRTQP